MSALSACDSLEMDDRVGHTEENRKMETSINLALRVKKTRQPGAIYSDLSRIL